MAGVRLGVAEAGIRKANRRDLTVIALAEGSRAAGVFTRNRFCAVPVQLCRTHLAGHAIRALVINTGVANAGTGETGRLSLPGGAGVRGGNDAQPATPRPQPPERAYAHRHRLADWGATAMAVRRGVSRRNAAMAAWVSAGRSICGT